MLETGRDWKLGEIGNWERLETGRDWKLGGIGNWEGLETGRDWELRCMCTFVTVNYTLSIIIQI